MKTCAIGDIHGAYKALIQCFKRSKFDYQKDRLIVMKEYWQSDLSPDLYGGLPNQL
jgi:hypothetical protein